MFRMKLDFQPGEKLKVLCLGAHSDDIEIGCGGTILKLIEEYPNIQFHWIVFGSSGQRSIEAKKSAAQFLKKVNFKHVEVRGFRDGFFPYVGAEIKDYFEQIKVELSPDLIFTHYRHDLHQDHRLICELTWNTFRDNLILEYEIPKYDGDLGAPNCYSHLNEEICNRKIQYISDSFESQKDKHWFSPDTFLSIMRLRGIESRSPERYAEAFYCRKFVI